MRSYECRSCSAAPWNRYSLSQSLRTSKFKWKCWRAYATCRLCGCIGDQPKKFMDALDVET